MGYRFDRHLDQSKVLEVTLGALNEFVEKRHEKRLETAWF